MKKFSYILFFCFLFLLNIKDSNAVNHAKKSQIIENKTNVNNVKIITKLFNGEEFDISQNKRKTILVFWVKWCGMCKKQLKNLNKIQEKLLEKNIQTIGISVDNSSDYDDAKKIAKSLSFKNANFYDAKFINIKQPEAIPTTLFLDENLNIIKIYEGIIDERTILEF